MISCDNQCCQSGAAEGIMTKKSTSKPIAEPPPPEQEKDLSTLSVRFTDEQRDLLVRAAALKGWTPTALIRTAALERAAHMVNTARVTKFDFKGLASELAERLFQTRTVEYHLTQEDYEAMSHEQGPSSFDVAVRPLPLETLFRLKEAARLGGAEFLRAVVDFAEGLTASQRHDLPDPVDPAKADSQ
jgi:uncharacterized protein (DUF1778 family)